MNMIRSENLQTLGPADALYTHVMHNYYKIKIFNYQIGSS